MKHFTINELTKTNTGIKNIPNKDEKDNLVKLVENILDPLRELFGKPIFINSGYRNPIVNRKINGAINSAHMSGRAADIRGANRSENKKLFELIRDNFKFRQLIWEKGSKDGPDWVHVEYNENDNKKEILRYDGKKYKKL